jgi:serine protease Do
MSLSRARLVVFVASILGAGFLVGLIVSGRLELTTPSVAAVDEQQAAVVTPASPAAAAVTAGGALPDLSTIAERALEVSVNISSTNLVRVPADPFFGAYFGNRVQRSQSLGSGVIVSADGYILTNTHVIGNQSESIRVTTTRDGQERPAKLIGIDEVSDLAVVKIDGTDLPTLPWGDSLRLRVAEWVLAVGNPYQLNGTVTLGIVSTVSRSAEQVGSYQDFIQTDAAINPGNSGGALINARGELVGINTMIYTQTGGYQGIGFAIPSNAAREIMNELIQNGVVSWGSIGGVGWVTIDERAARRNGLPSAGVYVENILRNASAYRAGLEPGDFVVAINDQPAISGDQILRIVTRMKVGTTVTLRVFKQDGRQVDLRVPVVARAER